MNASDTQLDVLKFLRGSQLDDAFMLVSRLFKSAIEGRRDLLPLRALFRLSVEVKDAGASVIFKVTVEEEYVPSRTQTFQAPTLTSAIDRAFDFCGNSAIEQLSLSGAYWHDAELSQHVVAQFVDRLALIPVHSILLGYLSTEENDVLSILQASKGVRNVVLYAVSFSATDAFVSAVGHLGTSRLTMVGPRVTFEGIKAFIRGTWLDENNVRLLSLFDLRNIQQLFDNTVKFFLNDKDTRPLILHMKSSVGVDATSFASHAVDCGTFIRYTFTKVPLTMIIEGTDVYFFRGRPFPDLPRYIPQRFASYLAA